jgi:hypothetical protein
MRARFFVSTDAAALASHMDDCASSRGRFFGLKSALESAHCMLFPRLITAVAVGVVVVAALTIV